ncbi:MAG: protein kinase [Acidobacteria bacterium]|nr:protein kinase [Acidobacteriota bacterium]
MNAERLQRIEEICHAALDATPEERAAFLEKQCGADADLRREVESLLDFDKSADLFFDSSPESFAAEMFSERENGAVNLVNREVGHYRILKLLGRGGMGEVYLAEDKELERHVAVKVLLPEVADDRARLGRFVREARAASALNHPNILTVHEIGGFENSRFIATEFVAGETLRDRLRGAEPLDLRETLDAALQIAAALAAAHEAGIVHRDIKPENIMLRDDGFVKVLDFGLAKLTEERRRDAATQRRGENESTLIAASQTESGVVMGTAAYMSPEQARGLAVDARTDIWSFGIVLYEMLAGKTPFEGETTSDVIAAILKSEPPFAPDKFPEDLQRIVGKALEKDRAERYQNVRDLLTDLRDLKQELDFTAKLEQSKQPTKSKKTPTGESIYFTETQNARQTSSAEYVVAEIKNHKAGFLALAVLLLAAIGLGYWFFPSRSSGAAPISSIAVLPFENASGDAGLDYLSDGVSESVIDRLSQFPQLKVIARSSSFKYRGVVNLSEAANALGVQAIVTGKVIKRGDDLTIRVELVDARDNRQLWSENYKRRAADALFVQQEIAQTVSQKLRLPTTDALEERQLAKGETTNPLAYELVLKGRYARSKGTAESRKKAIEYYKQAITVDPNYALAFAELSAAYSGLGNTGDMNPQEANSIAKAAAEKALELDANLPEAHIALASIAVDEWNWTAAEREFRRVIETSPNVAVAHNKYALYLLYTGRFEEAVSEIKRANELNPVAPGASLGLSFILHYARRHDEAIEVARRLLELDPNNYAAHVYIADAYSAKGMHREAVAEYQEAIRLGGDSLSLQIYLGYALAMAGERGAALAILNRLQTTKEYASPAELAALYAGLGDRESAFRTLERAFAERDLQLQFLKIDPHYDSLRGDARFQDLLRRVGLPQ